LGAAPSGEPAGLTVVAIVRKVFLGPYEHNGAVHSKAASAKVVTAEAYVRGEWERYARTFTSTHTRQLKRAEPKMMGMPKSQRMFVVAPEERISVDTEKERDGKIRAQ
jgi:hypothetical protein